MHGDVNILITERGRGAGLHYISLNTLKDFLETIIFFIIQEDQDGHFP